MANVADVVRSITIKAGAEGIRESAGFNAFIVILKLIVIFIVICVGAYYVDPDNWKPFAPYGLGGIGLFGKTLIGQSTATFGSDDIV